MTHSSAPTYILGVLPARWGSTRFPGKPLHLIAGKPLIQHVWERCLEYSMLDEIIVATDDERIRDAVIAFVGKVAMTSPNHPADTERIADQDVSPHHMRRIFQRIEQFAAALLDFQQTRLLSLAGCHLRGGHTAR